MRKTILIFTTLISFLLAQETTYKTFHDCTFSVDIPTNYYISPMYEEDPDNESTLDYCHFELKNYFGYTLVEFHSYLKTGWGVDNDLQGSYDDALSKNGYQKVTYKVYKGNWFVISGIDKNGKYFYWKKVEGDSFYSSMIFTYDDKFKEEIEKIIPVMVKSFTSD